MIHCLSIGPHHALGHKCPDIAEGQKAYLTCFDPTIATTYTHADLRSKSKNNPFINLPLRGKVIGIVNGKMNTL